MYPTHPFFTEWKISLYLPYSPSHCWVRYRYFPDTDHMSIFIFIIEHTEATDLRALQVSGSPHHPTASPSPSRLKSCTIFLAPAPLLLTEGLGNLRIRITRFPDLVLPCTTYGTFLTNGKALKCHQFLRFPVLWSGGVIHRGPFPLFNIP